MYIKYLIMSCLICCDDFNQSNKMAVKCQYCDFEACRTCCQTYILSNMATTCMNPDKNEKGEKKCDKTWTREFVVNNFTKSFVSKEWKQMREKTLYDQQKALLPATMGIVENRKEVKKIEKEMYELEKLINSLKIEWSHKLRNKENLEYGKTTSSSKVFVRPCSDPDCRGFLNQQWICGICEKKTCKDCNVIKENDEHKCDDNDKQTFELLKKDTKPCVKCQTPIFKIEGCDQMWCTQCHTAFSWKTGRIEHNIHNPHYYEYQRNNNVTIRNEGDYECGRELNYNAYQILGTMYYRFIDAATESEKNFKSFEGLIEIRKKHYTDKASWMESMYRKIMHLKQYELPKYRTDAVTDYEQFRIQFLEGDLDESGFARNLQKKEKAIEKKKDIFNILSLMIQLLTDCTFIYKDKIKKLIPNAFPGRGTPKEQILYLKNNTDFRLKIGNLFNDLIMEFRNIEKFCNKLMHKHNETYKLTKKRLNLMYQNNYDIHTDVLQTGEITEEEKNYLKT